MSTQGPSRIQTPMPLNTKPEDLPAAVRFSIEPKDGYIEVAGTALPQKEEWRYRLHDGAVRFADHDAFKAKVVYVGMSPAVAEDIGRSFNATARQLRELGFAVELPEQEANEKQQAA
ncbi:MAG TPA: hypothetical protein VHE33_14930 [Acidobacteriaceae bacterium]|nr:hypothetical protein [Acidobacteriaceae bacterium]